jgi:hypothetical protein
MLKPKRLIIIEYLTTLESVKERSLLKYFEKILTNKPALTPAEL